MRGERAVLLLAESYSTESSEQTRARGERRRARFCFCLRAAGCSLVGSVLSRCRAAALRVVRKQSERECGTSQLEREISCVRGAHWIWLQGAGWMQQLPIATGKTQKLSFLLFLIIVCRWFTWLLLGVRTFVIVFASKVLKDAAAD